MTTTITWKNNTWNSTASICACWNHRPVEKACPILYQKNYVTSTQGQPTFHRLFTLKVSSFKYRNGKYTCVCFDLFILFFACIVCGGPYLPTNSYASHVRSFDVVRQIWSDSYFNHKHPVQLMKAVSHAGNPGIASLPGWDMGPTATGLAGECAGHLATTAQYVSRILCLFDYFFFLISSVSVLCITSIFWLVYLFLHIHTHIHTQ